MRRPPEWVRLFNQVWPVNAPFPALPWMAALGREEAFEAFLTGTRRQSGPVGGPIDGECGEEWIEAQSETCERYCRDSGYIGSLFEQTFDCAGTCWCYEERRDVYDDVEKETGSGRSIVVEWVRAYWVAAGWSASDRQRSRLNLSASEL